MTNQLTPISVVAASFWIEDRKESGTSGFFRGKGFKTIDQSRFSEEKHGAVICDHTLMKVDFVATTVMLFPMQVLAASKMINLKRHLHNRYDTLLATYLKKAGVQIFVSTKPLDRHIYGDKPRYRPFKHLTLSGFIQSRRCNPLDVSYVLGILELSLLPSEGVLRGQSDEKGSQEMPP